MKTAGFIGKLIMLLALTFVLNSGAGCGPPKISLSAVTITPTKVAPGQPVSITVTVLNAEKKPFDYLVHLKINGIDVETKSVSLNSGQSQSVTFHYVPEFLGSYRVDLNGETGTFDAVKPAHFVASMLTVSPESPSVGQEVQVTTQLANDGELAGTYVAVLKVDGKEISSDEVQLDAGTSVALARKFTADSVGTSVVEFCGLMTSISTASTISPITTPSPETTTPEPPTTTPPPRVTSVTIQSPLSNERFVKGEVVTFKASIESETAVDGSELQWTSDKDGNLGNGLEIETSRLSCGTHKIDIIGYGQNVSFAIRVFNDLWELYQASPAQGEIDRILNDFTFSWVDGSADDERWANYDSWSFDQESINPAKIVAIAKLDVLRHQRFSEPLPFQNVIGEETVYEHIRRYVTTIELRLDANPNYAGNGRVSVNRGFSMWYGMLSGTKTAVTEIGLFQYVSSLYLLVHEARHCEPGEPGHTTLPNGVQGDATLENGSGHAQAALYCMWVYQYGLYEALATKQSAQEIAVLLLTTRFSSKPTHSNPNVQAILDQLLP